MTKPFTSNWWNIMANKASIQARYNIKYKKVALFCWQRAESRESYKCIQYSDWAESSKAADQFHTNHLKNTFHTKH
jgi:hypothetical protein